MIVQEYCESMNRQLAAWRENVRKLLVISESLSGISPSANEHQQREDLQTLIDDIGKVAEMLKKECLVA